MDAQGARVPGALVEIWKCDALGRYRHPRGRFVQRPSVDLRPGLQRRLHLGSPFSAAARRLSGPNVFVFRTAPTAGDQGSGGEKSLRAPPLSSTTGVALARCLASRLMRFSVGTNG